MGASPADLVFGEGLALPGKLLGSASQDDPTTLQRHQLLGDLHLKVARLISTPTSAHPQQHIHFLESQGASSHVFIWRGGVQASLMTL